MSNRLDTHLARAIRLYGPEAFVVEQIDSANTQEELNQKEIQWIHFYDSIKQGYNETDSGLKCGGNTYQYKTDEEMAAIRNKINERKQGGKNPNARAVKCKSVITNEEHIFNSLSEMQNFFQATNHSFISARCNGRINCLYKKEWMIAYADADYSISTIEKGNRKSKKIEVTNLDNDEIKQFESFASAERYYGLPSKALSGKAYRHKDQEYFIVQKKYRIKVLE